MKILILACNILVPIIMIAIGSLYKRHLYKIINNIFDLFRPIAMIGSGIGDDSNRSLLKNEELVASANKKCSFIWTITGVCTLIVTSIVLLLNRANIAVDTSFSDINNVSIITLEVELAVVVAVFITVEYILKKKLYKRI